MASFNNNSFSKPETPAERRAATRAFDKAQRARVAVLSLNGKTKLLARAIVKAAADRSIVTERDGIQAGLTPSEVTTLFPAALEVARSMEPRLPEMVAA